MYSYSALTALLLGAVIVELVVCDEHDCTADYARKDRLLSALDNLLIAGVEDKMKIPGLEVLGAEAVDQKSVAEKAQLTCDDNGLVRVKTSVSINGNPAVKLRVRKGRENACDATVTISFSAARPKQGKSQPDASVYGIMTDTPDRCMKLLKKGEKGKETLNEFHKSIGAYYAGEFKKIFANGNYLEN